MKFLDGVNVTYVHKNEKSNLSKLLNQITKSETKIELKPVNGKYYGNFRIEFYAPIESIPTIKLTGFLTSDNPIEWLMEKDDQSAIVIDKIFHVVDTEIIEIDESKPVVAVILDQYKVYALVNSELTKDFTLNQLVEAALKRLFEVYFDDEFRPEEYDVEVHPELTDYFL
ncbi:hypothetical protein SAMN04488510_10197 [Fervidobacterium changbaicum]|uniref:Uncharacterized protein n=2 Tax=Fervidobacterium TaxID=2422 RepID=A0AAI8CL41_FERIS|nr:MULTISPECIES: hypothetical protein [Fervidobacterium]AMW33377.1 hypothetical protein NA23_09135 [Fervidobacterium islandicum]QAV33410.1 hypothetical protein CBS1_06540 [Fervidobacterium changbaicum]SDG91601.1 hypothetical protein SAMN04488510_10197 [Fervidobacterium changbaicum]